MIKIHQAFWKCSVQMQAHNQRLGTSNTRALTIQITHCYTSTCVDSLELNSPHPQLSSLFLPCSAHLGQPGFL